MTTAYKERIIEINSKLAEISLITEEVKNSLSSIEHDLYRELSKKIEQSVKHKSSISDTVNYLTKKAIQIFLNNNEFDQTYAIHNFEKEFQRDTNEATFRAYITHLLDENVKSQSPLYENDDERYVMKALSNILPTDDY